MDLLVVKILSALVLWILSLCFGLMIPYLLWRSRAAYQETPHQHCDMERDSLLSDEENQTSYQSTANGQAHEDSLESPRVSVLCVCIFAFLITVYCLGRLCQTVFIPWERPKYAI